MIRIPVTRTTVTVHAKTYEKLREENRDGEPLYETIDRALDSLEE